MSKRRKMSQGKKDIIAGLIEEYERSDNPEYRNGVKSKKICSSYGEIPIDVPQDRDGDFTPQIVPKRKKDISEIERKIISMSAKGMTIRQVSAIIEDIYRFEVSKVVHNYRAILECA